MTTRDEELAQMQKEKLRRYQIAASGRFDELSDEELKKLRIELFTSSKGKISSDILAQLALNEETSRASIKLARKATVLTGVAVLVGLIQIAVALFKK